MPSLSRRYSVLVLWLAVVVVAANLAWLATVLSDLRPAADDYGYGSQVILHGVLGGVARWWMTWSGYAATVFAGNLLVGWPLAYLPFSLASSVTLVAALTAMGVMVAAVVGGGPASGIGWRRGPLAVLFGVVAWWFFLWTKAAGGLDEDEVLLMAYGATHWQTLNGMYVVTSAVLLTLWAATRRAVSGDAGGGRTVLLAALVGAVAGFSGPALSLAVAVWAGGAVAWGLVWARYGAGGRKRFEVESAPGSAETRRRWWTWGALLGVLLPAALAAHKLSPGNRIRSTYIESPELTASLGQLWEIVVFTVPFSLKFWLRSYASVGTGLVFAAAVSLIHLWSPPADAGEERRLVRWGVGLGAFALMYTGVSRFAEFLTYYGYWHFLMPYTCVFLSVVCLGVACGRWFARSWPTSRPAAWRAATGTLLLMLGLGTLVNRFAMDSIEARGVAWRNGAASDRGVSDIDVPGGWQRAGWKGLNELRAEPITRGWASLQADPPPADEAVPDPPPTDDAPSNTDG